MYSTSAQILNSILKLAFFPAVVLWLFLSRGAVHKALSPGGEVGGKGVEGCVLPRGGGTAARAAVLPKLLSQEKALMITPEAMALVESRWEGCRPESAGLKGQKGEQVSFSVSMPMCSRVASPRVG